MNPESNIVNASQLKAFLRENLTMPIEHYITPMIQGIPGVGKSEIVTQTCQELDLRCKVIRPIQHETVEFTGVPVAWRDETGAKAAWGALEDLLPPDDGWVVFLDELTQLQVNEQKVMAGLLDKEGVAGRRVGPNTRFICAGNRMQDRAGSNRLISIIESRTWQVELVFSTESWLEWASDKGIEVFIQEFARMKGGNFVNFDPSRSLNALPRTWERVDRAIKYAPTAADCMIRGLVGNGMAAELKAFRNHFDILRGALQRIVETGTHEDPNAVVKREATTKDESEKEIRALSIQHALTGACTHYARENPRMSDKHLSNLLGYASTQLEKPLAAVFMHRLVHENVKGSDANRELATRVASHKTWLDFISKNRDVVSQWKSKT